MEAKTIKEGQIHTFTSTECSLFCKELKNRFVVEHTEYIRMMDREWEFVDFIVYEEDVNTLSESIRKVKEDFDYIVRFFDEKGYKEIGASAEHESNYININGKNRLKVIFNILFHDENIEEYNEQKMCKVCIVLDYENIID